MAKKGCKWLDLDTKRCSNPESTAIDSSGLPLERPVCIETYTDYTCVGHECPEICPVCGMAYNGNEGIHEKIGGIRHVTR